MNTLKAGFCRVDITPMLGIPVRGYYQLRFADGVLDPLTANFLALSCGDTKALMITLDVCSVNRINGGILRKAISEATGLPMEAVFMSATHTHTGPEVDANSETPLSREYFQMLTHKLCDGAVMALADLKPAKMGWGIGTAPNIAFVRRFRMKDGSVRTNPGVNNPDILHPIGEIDERVTVLRFDREGAETLILSNFGNHPDVVGGCKLSADWPGLLRTTTEKYLDNTRCIFFNGAQGDLNHVNVRPTGGFLNGTFNDFDDVSRGYPHALYMARVVAGGILQAFDKVAYTDVDSLKFLQRAIQVPSNKCDPSELPEAHRIHNLRLEGRANELPYEGMMLTTVLAAAARKVRLEDGPDFFEMELSALSIGNLSFVGIPGEPFMAIGKAFKETEGWDLVIPCCLTNGGEGYFPMLECYEEGGYEAGSSSFKAGVAELIIDEGRKMLSQLKEA